MKLGDQVFFVERYLDADWCRIKGLGFYVRFGTLVSVHDGYAIVRIPSWPFMTEESTVKYDKLFSTRKDVEQWLVDALGIDVIGV